MSPSTWSGPPPQDISAWNLIQVAHLVGRRFHTALALVGLTPTQFGTLIQLDLHPEMSNNQIARAVLVTPQTMSELLTSLQLLGLVERAASAGRGRRVAVRLTDAGRDVLERSAHAIGQVEASLGLDGGQQQVLNGLLNHILTTR